MKAVVVMYDTLNRRFLPPYGGDWVKAPNFERLADHAVTFDAAYAGSLPTIPCRREWHTGRYNFLHRRWGPVEPFDDSVPEILRENGVWSHLATDGYHYFEDGGSTYHNRYRSWEFFRGQEGDLWHPDLTVKMPEHLGRANRTGRQDWINRRYTPEEEDWPQYGTFSAACRFLRTNAREDGWLLHAETFDPHEPYFAPEKYRQLYPHKYDGPFDDWPGYRRCEGDPPELIEHYRCEHAALTSMCDASLGRVLDLFDELDLWKDTLLIVTTDHGFLLGEHGWTGKMKMPCWDEIARIPLFIWDPRSGRKGARSKCLVQTIDFAPTLLEYFGQEIPPDVQGKVLKDAVAEDKPVREAGLFGTHGGHVNVTDGRCVYMRAPVSAENQPLFNYTLIPTNMKGWLPEEGFPGTEMAPPFGFTKGMPVMKMPAGEQWGNAFEFGNLLYDTESDPGQEKPLSDPEVEKRLISQMVALMRENEAPAEQYTRLGLEI
ncbi:MAG: sulfatase-like hydrolase/transferase [Planctomycetota bacterium]